MISANVANVLGAASALVFDEVQRAVRSAEREESSTTALVHLAKYPGESIDGLRRVLELSHSGCVRVVDRLAQAKFLERRGAQDRRAVALHLTRSGRAAAADALRLRGEALSRTLRVLSASEQVALGQLLSKLVSHCTTSPAEAARTCRLCDYAACVECPAVQALTRAHE